jgi:predicted nuclease with TOPRIM domain
MSGDATVTNDLSYFRRRASEERTAALNARDPRVCKVHREMADRYEERVRGMAAHHEMLFMPLVEMT